ncbi:MAG TPA: FadR family transcriptional regulator [Clostridiaceae bacterium]|nr:FadR family transcriptional regulator [Clostridiaceae bacterium]
MLKPLKKTRLYEEIIKQLTDLINNGSLKPGDKLPTERDLAVQLNVSRTAIREALRSLEMMGFIESKVGEGTFVKEITLNNVIDPFSSILSKDKKLVAELIEVRILLESEIARLAAARINDDKAAEIERCLDLMAREIAEGGIGIKGDNQFHNALAKAAENTAMSKILNMCGDLLNSSREVALKSMKDTRIGLKHHRDIFEAVKAGDEKKASELMRNHLEEASKNVQGIEDK